MKNICGRTTPVSLPLIVVTVELLHKQLSKLESWWLSETASSCWWGITALPYSTYKSLSHFASQFKLRSGLDSDFLAPGANRTKPCLQGVSNHTELGIHKRITLLSRRRTCSLPLSRSNSPRYLASSLDILSRLFLWPIDLSSRISPWTKGSASTQRGCAVLTGVERCLSVCSPPGSAGTLWSVPSTGLSNRAQSHHRRRQRTSEPLTLG